MSGRNESGGLGRLRRRAWLQTGVSALVTVGILGVLYRQVTWTAVRGMLGSVWLPAAAAYVALSLLMQVLRTLRYGVVLKGCGHAAPPGRLFLVVLVRGLFVDLLPARLGELVYVYLLTSRLGIPAGAALSSFALPFLFDVVALAPLLLVALPWAGTGGALNGWWLGGGALALAAGAVLVWQALPAALRAAAWVVARVLPEGHGVRRRVWRLVAGMRRHLARARRARMAGKLLGLSILVRLAKYAALYVLLWALTHGHGYGPATLPVASVFLGLVAAEMAASLPISGLAGFGAYEGAWSVVFGLLVFPPALARTTSLAHHLFTQVYGYGIGLLALLLLLALPAGRGRIRHLLSDLSSETGKSNRNPALHDQRESS